MPTGLIYTIINRLKWLKREDDYMDIKKVKDKDLEFADADYMVQYLKLKIEEIKKSKKERTV